MLYFDFNINGSEFNFSIHPDQIAAFRKKIPVKPKKKLNRWHIFLRECKKHALKSAADLWGTDFENEQRAVEIIHEVGSLLMEVKILDIELGLSPRFKTSGKNMPQPSKKLKKKKKKGPKKKKSYYKKCKNVQEKKEIIPPEWKRETAKAKVQRKVIVV